MYLEWAKHEVKQNVHIMSDMPFIAQCVYSKIVVSIKVCLLGYTVPSQTIVV